MDNNNKIIDGKKQSIILLNQIHTQTLRLNIQPKLAIIVIGNNPASDIYIKIKTKRASDVGIATALYTLEHSIETKELVSLIEELNNDKTIHGIIVQMPLPHHIDKSQILNSILYTKDVDGFSPYNAGCLVNQCQYFVPCTPLGIMHLIKSVKENLAGLRATIIGRSNIVGKPVAELLLQSDCTINIVHSKSFNIQNECVQSDIIVAAVGQPKLIKSNWIKKDSIIIDVGINRVNSEIVGDVDFEDVIDKVKYITPVPGGVGPMTVAYLLYNTLQAAINQQ